MKEKELKKVKEAMEVQEDIPGMHADASRARDAGWSLANTGENSTPY